MNREQAGRIVRVCGDIYQALHPGIESIDLYAAYLDGTQCVDNIMNGVPLRRKLEEPDGWYHFIPNEQVARTLLFAGAENYEALREGVKERIRGMLRNVASLPLYDFQHDVVDIPLPDRLSQVFELMRYLEIDKFSNPAEANRKTGEPGFSHELRIVLDVCDFIDRVNGMYCSEGNLFYFTPESAQLLIMLALTHDFLEYKPSESVKKSIQSHASFNGYEETRYELVLLRQQGSDHSSYTITTIPHDLHAQFIGNLAALTSEGKTERDTVRQLFETLGPKRNYSPRRMTSIWLDSSVMIVKMLDRLDNMRTRSFTGKGVKKYGLIQTEDFRLPDPESLIRKCAETIKAYGSVESSVSWSHGYGWYRRGNLLPVLNLPRQLMRQMLYDPFADFKPSRIALAYLMGFGPNDLFYTFPEYVERTHTIVPSMDGNVQVYDDPHLVINDKPPGLHTARSYPKHNLTMR